MLGHFGMIPLLNHDSRLRENSEVDMQYFAQIIISQGDFNPSEKYESQLGWLFPIYGEKTKCSKPPARLFIYIYNGYIVIYIYIYHDENPHQADDGSPSAVIAVIAPGSRETGGQDCNSSSNSWSASKSSAHP